MERRAFIQTLGAFAALAGVDPRAVLALPDVEGPFRLSLRIVDGPLLELVTATLNRKISTRSWDEIGQPTRDAGECSFTFSTPTQHSLAAGQRHRAELETAGGWGRLAVSMDGSLERLAPATLKDGRQGFEGTFQLFGYPKFDLHTSTAALLREHGRPAGGR